jgi:DNA (cytosine-5)-methyltransferase 1
MVGRPQRLRLINVFAGCGGPPFGLSQAGWKGLFAIEADDLAFETPKHSLICDQHPQYYDRPNWLLKTPKEITKFINDHRKELEGLAGAVELIAVGPPGQGFSVVERRKKYDPMIRLLRHYLKTVEIKPPLFFFVNVRGVTVEFDKKARGNHRLPGPRPTPFSSKTHAHLRELGYKVYPQHLRAVDFGVPQFRPRYIMIAIERNYLAESNGFCPFTHLEDIRTAFLRERGLPTNAPVTVRDAISDLETSGQPLVACDDAKGFLQGNYKRPETNFQRLMHGNLNGTSPNSMRLAKHRNDIRERFSLILDTCRRGVQLSPADRERLGIKKKCLTPLDASSPSHTLTTLPDDLLHYSEPRILTVREYARLQTFPDWYAFKGKYTTGGSKRIRECPRYTQVGNAVPPFLAEILGRLLKEIASKLLTANRSVKAPLVEGRR